MNEKMRSDAKLGSLTLEQQDKLNQWLFGENRSLDEVSKLCETEFGVDADRNCVWRYRKRERSGWELRRMARTVDESRAARGHPRGIPDDPYVTLLETIEVVALNLVREKREQVQSRELANLVNLLISARRLVNQQQKTAMLKEKLEFDAATACLIHKIEFDRICNDKALDEGGQIRAVRQRLFGPNLPE